MVLHWRGTLVCLPLLCDHFLVPVPLKRLRAPESNCLLSLTLYPGTQHHAWYTVGAELMVVQRMDPTKEVSYSFHSFPVPSSSEDQ